MSAATGGRFAFVTLGAFSGINESVLDRLKLEFPDLEVDHLEIDAWVRGHRLILAANLAAVVLERGPLILRDRRRLWGAFYRTSFIQRAIRRHMRRRVATSDDYRFTFQTQSLFDASTDRLPHFVYTDHTELVQERYPDFDPGQAAPRRWIELERRIYQHARAVFTMSTHVSRSLVEQYAMPGERIHRVGAGSNLAVPAEDPLPDYASRRIVFVGRDWERKGGPDLLAAFAEVRQRIPDVTLAIAGCSPIIDQPGVTVLGELSPAEVRRQYLGAAVFGMPTLVEPFGIVFVEALAHGLPVVSTEVGALPDIVRDGETGYLHAPHDISGLAQSLETLLGDPERCRQMGSAGRSSVSGTYTWSQAVASVAGEIRTILQSEGGAMGARERRLRVLTLTDIASRQGGAEWFAVALASHLPPARFESWLCSTRVGEREVERQLADSGVRYLSLGRRGRWDLIRLAGLVRLLRRQRIDVLHAHKFGSNFWGAVIGRLCRVPVILAHEHTWSYEGNPLRAWLDGHVIGRLATRFVAVSQHDRERMISVEGVAPEKVVVIPAAVHVSRGPSTSTDLRVELGIEKEDPIVATVALLRPQKALSVLLEAFARLLPRWPHAHLVIAGDGPCRATLEERTLALGIAGSVHFLGRRSDIDSILTAADVAALSSDFEGTPVFLAEAVANGTALVATAVGGIPDLFEHERSAILVPPRDPDALAAAISRLLLDPEARRQMAEAARVRLAGLTIDAVAERFGELYEALLEERNQGGSEKAANRG